MKGRKRGEELATVSVQFGLPYYRDLYDVARSAHQSLNDFVMSAVVEKADKVKQRKELIFVGDGRLDDYCDRYCPDEDDVDNLTELGQITYAIMILCQTWNCHRVRMDVPAVRHFGTVLANKCDDNVARLVNSLISDATHKHMTARQYEKRLDAIYFAVIDFLDKKTGGCVA